MRKVDGELGLVARDPRAGDLIHLVLRLQGRQEGGRDAQTLQNHRELHDQRLEQTLLGQVRPLQSGRHLRRVSSVLISRRVRLHLVVELLSFGHATRGPRDPQFLQRRAQLFAASSHHSVQRHRMLRNVDVHRAHCEQPRVLVFGLPAEARVESLRLPHGYFHDGSKLN